MCGGKRLRELAFRFARAYRLEHSSGDDTAINLAVGIERIADQQVSS